MKNTKDRINDDRLICKNFVLGGGNEALFWSGRLSQAARDVIMSPLIYAEDKIKWLDLVREEYDAVIIKRANQDDEEEKRRGPVYLGPFTR